MGVGENECGEDVAMIISPALLLLIKAEQAAKFAGSFAMERRSRGRGFKSTLLHHPVSRFSDIAEN
jgi:hypothetical protein